MFRLTARNTVPRRVAAFRYSAGASQARGMADQRVEDASQAAGEAKKSSSPEVSFWPTVQEKLISAEVR